MAEGRGYDMSVVSFKLQFEKIEQQSDQGFSMKFAFPIWSVLYGITACSCAILSKSLITFFGIRNFALVQVAQGLLVMFIARSGAKEVIDTFRGLKERPDGAKSGMLLALPAVFGACSAALGFYAQARVNIPMMLVLRRTNTIFTLVAEFVFLSKVPTSQVRNACVVIVLGSLVAGYRDLTFNPEGYVLIFMQNSFTTASTIATTYVKQRFSFSSYSMMFIMAMMAFPFNCTWAMFSDCSMSLNFTSALLVGVLIVLGGCNGLVTTQSVTKHSPLTTSVAGNVKDIAQTFVGAFAFGDYKFDPGNLVGILISFVGCGFYAYTKMMMSAAPAKAKAN